MGIPNASREDRVEVEDTGSKAADQATAAVANMPEHPGETHFPTLSPEDQTLLGTLDRKLMVVRDRVRGVVKGYTTGFFLHGEGGNCKSYTVTRELDRLGADYKVHNSRMTGRGLFDVLARHPDSIHLLEDVEGLFRDAMAQGVLRSALWGQRRDGEMERLVTWNAFATSLQFYFTGGIVVTSNRPLADLPELRALATRVNPVQLACTNHEIAALMRKVALDGYRHRKECLGPAACLEVAGFVIEHCLRANRNLDMRLLVNGFADRLQHEAGETECHWHDLLLCRLVERAVPAKESRADRLDREREVAREVKGLPREERFRVWRERTGRSEAALYRRLAELDGFLPGEK